ncbi:hypothetical protein K1516_16785 [Stenotrophomonas maltophilia]|uniref:hypothetical protein n=1 Tax=Stenotrophomonas maltophilia TaxID=40324 RepID=UPI00200FCA4D|nr:hypothetical protein [Stenotrophomonas maltophilia]UQA69574.1 hypothetical protein K1516_16785 [Stenotrophomonas maltophilia]
MTGRTQGPWAYQEQSDAYTHIVRGPNNRFICQLSQDSSGESEKTARLISAAPEMCDELEMLCNVLEGGAEPLPAEVEARIAFARAAIAKANGEQP